jgi:hypothetical protein
MYRDDRDYAGTYGADILEGKTIGRMVGCFCPPHKGHFFTWERACKDLNLDILFLSSTNAAVKEKSRHGIPLKFTEWVISRWALHLQNADGNPVQVIFRADTPLPKIATNSFKQLYLIQIGEGEATTKAENEREKEIWLAELKAKNNSEEDDPDIAWGRKNKITQSEKRPEYPYYKIANKTYWRDTTNPAAKSPSATKFTKCLKAFKSNPSDESCYDYLPDFMTTEEKAEYIAEIMDNYYTDERSSGEPSAKRSKIEGGKRKAKTKTKRKAITKKKRTKRKRVVTKRKRVVTKRKRKSASKKRKSKHI